ncbi:O-antigen ligase family protein [Paludibacter sp.]|uniref:O-antigen ligase family protein n=1 Tax=Paludibacter sp. TaxID=1898105 RepID=UPI00135487BE|nr:O-antigen ligase family protein [Paludibacter sp.]MTK52799.1 hypothetical protein [Paludibacter sp.]
MYLNLNRVMIALMYGMVLVDMMTGYQLIANPDLNFTPGIFYKLLLLILLFYFMPRLNPLVMVVNILLYTTTLFSSLLSDISTIPTNIINASKFLMFITFFYYLTFLSKRNVINNRTLYNIALFTYVVIIINQIFGILGFGKATYMVNGIPVGTSGFFFEHNATGIVLLIVSAIIYMYRRNSISNIKLLSFAILTLIIGFSFATKTAIIGSVIIALIAFYDRQRKYLPLVVGLGAVLIMLNWGVIQETGQVSKVIDQMDQDESNALLSGREDRFVKGTNDYFVKFTFLEKAIGIGSYRFVNEDNGVGGSSEIDFIDILKISGLVGFIVVYIPFLWISYLCLHHYRRYKIKEFAIVLVLNIVFLVISSTAGHLFPSGSVTFYLALLNAYPFYVLNGKLDS